MTNQLKKINMNSIFKNVAGIEYFDFEEDFVEKNIRCIPMIVRFKMDAAGIKLKLSEWNRFSASEKIELAVIPCVSKSEVYQYILYLTGLIKKYTNGEATSLTVDINPAWSEQNHIPQMVVQKANEFNWKIELGEWRNLSDLQRFTLLKLCRPGHENKNFPKAMKEFDLINEN